MSNAIAWLDRDEGPVNYGEPTYWERRCECHRMSKSCMADIVEHAKCINVFLSV